MAIATQPVSTAWEILPVSQIAVDLLGTFVQNCVRVDNP